MAIYNFDKINTEVPIEAVLEMHGIYPQGKGSDKGWYSIRPDEKEPSAHIDKKRRYGNTIHDFGDSNTFNPITLTIYLRGLDKQMSEKEAKKEAARILGEEFGIEPEDYQNENSGKPSDHVSDWEWKELLIYPDAASKNMMFFPEKYGYERTRLYAEKYRIPMSDLKKEDINMYERIVNAKGFARAEELKNSYYWGLNNWYNMRKELNIEFEPENVKSDEEIAQKLNSLTTVERILEKALMGTSKSFHPNTYNVVKDLNRVINGEVALEMGKVSCRDIKRAAYQNKAKVFSCEPVSIEDYYKLRDNGLDNLDYAAQRKGDRVVLSFISTDSSRVNYLVQALRGKERNLAEILAESALEFQKGIQEDIVFDNKESDMPKPTSEKPNERVAASQGKIDAVIGIE